MRSGHHQVGTDLLDCFHERFFEVSAGVVTDAGPGGRLDPVCRGLICGEALEFRREFLSVWAIGPGAAVVTPT